MAMTMQILLPQHCENPRAMNHRARIFTPDCPFITHTLPESSHKILHGRPALPTLLREILFLKIQRLESFPRAQGCRGIRSVYLPANGFCASEGFGSVFVSLSCIS